tara:strand:- start:546 stop:671 length:126 start_codon:yes stop_codon:yes gene_type:complete
MLNMKISFSGWRMSIQILVGRRGRSTLARWRIEIYSGLQIS